MPEQWLSVAEAAATMKVHPRTIERRIASKKLEARRNADGLIQVKVELPDEPPPMVDPFETVRELADRQVDIAAGSASAIVKFAQEAADRATRELTVARQERDIARKQARSAWMTVSCAAGIMLAIVGVVVFWAMRISADAKLWQNEVGRAEERVRQAHQHAAAEAQRAEAAIRAQSRAEGELIAWKEQHSQVLARLQELQRRPAPEPAPNLLDRFTQLFAAE
jgi:hypothetical protein